jgi:hypothetical protein
VKGAAEAYRSLPESATPEQRQAAMKDYANMLQAEKAGKRESAARESYANVKGQQYAQAAKMFGPDLGGQSLDIANYNRAMVAKGINPFTVGGAALAMGLGTAVPGAGGMEVPSLAQEAEAKALAGEQAKSIRQQERNIKRAEYAGRYQITNPATYEAIENAKRAVRAQKIEAGLVGAPGQQGGTLSPEAGYKSQLAIQRLIKDQSSLPGLAEKKIAEGKTREAREKEERKQSVARQEPKAPEADLAKIAEYNAQRRAQELDEAERRRREALMPYGGYGGYYAYNY